MTTTRRSRLSALLVFVYIVAFSTLVACDDDDGGSTASVTTEAVIDVISASPNLVGTEVVLSAAQSGPGDDLTFTWSILDGPQGTTATLEEPHWGIATFNPDLPGQYMIQLTAAGEHGQDTAQALVTVTDPADVTPTAILTLLSEAPHRTGATLTFSGADSLPSGVVFSYAWALQGAPPASSAAMSDLGDGLAELVPDVAGAYTVALTVISEGGEDTTFLQVAVTEAPACASNIDCTEPAPICDVQSGRCVECQVLEDCAHTPGTVCSAGSCVCPGGDDWCPVDYCVDLDSDPDNCGSCGHACYGDCSAGACVDPWEAMSTVNAPSARAYHTAVWTGTHMIIWGGMTSTGMTNTGAMYELSTNTWSHVSTVGAPAARMYHTAVWTGDRMIVWGGEVGGSLSYDGGAFDPVTNTWESVTLLGAPVERRYHTAVWTGTSMIVWGGEDSGGDELNSGAMYDPATDTWTPMVASSTYRKWHTAVWNEALGTMMVYGGYGDGSGYTNVYFPYVGLLPGGVMYNPTTNTWQNLIPQGEPSARTYHCSVVVDEDLYIFGGYNGSVFLPTGSRYTQGGWLPFEGFEPTARRMHTCVWLSVANRIIVWGGQSSSTTYENTGAILDIATRFWVDSLPTAPEGRFRHTAVATANKMLIWGGIVASGYTDSGAIYTFTP